jgi:hypothetical protein
MLKPEKGKEKACYPLQIASEETHRKCAGVVDSKICGASGYVNADPRIFLTHKMIKKQHDPAIIKAEGSSGIRAIIGPVRKTFQIIPETTGISRGRFVMAR